MQIKLQLTLKTYNFLTGKLTIHHNIAMAATFDIQIPREWQYYVEKCFYMALLLNVLNSQKNDY
jgi:hypothetical protein